MARFDQTSLTIEHSVTGEKLTIPLDPASKSIYRFKRACIGLDRIKEKLGLTLYFVTLTVRDENVDAMNRDLNKFLNWLRNRFRREELEAFYVWVVELQKKRYRKYGIMALHWHFAIVCADGALPHSARRGGRMRLIEDGTVIQVHDIIRYWGKGDIVFSLRAWSPGVYGYLGKYFSKDYEQLGEYNPDWSSLRRFGCSQLGHYRWANWGYEWAEKEMSENPELAELNMRKVGAKVGFFAKDEKGKYIAERELRSPWRLATPDAASEEQGEAVATTLE